MRRDELYRYLDLRPVSRGMRVELRFVQAWDAFRGLGHLIAGNTNQNITETSNIRSLGLFLDQGGPGTLTVAELERLMISMALLGASRLAIRGSTWRSRTKPRLQTCHPGGYDVAEWAAIGRVASMLVVELVPALDVEELAGSNQTQIRETLARLTSPSGSRRVHLGYDSTGQCQGASIALHVARDAGLVGQVWARHPGPRVVLGKGSSPEPATGPKTGVVAEEWEAGCIARLRREGTVELVAVDPAGPRTPDGDAWRQAWGKGVAPGESDGWALPGYAHGRVWADSSAAQPGIERGGRLMHHYGHGDLVVVWDGGGGEGWAEPSSTCPLLHMTASVTYASPREAAYNRAAYARLAQGVCGLPLEALNAAPLLDSPHAAAEAQEHPAARIPGEAPPPPHPTLVASFGVPLLLGDPVEADGIEEVARFGEATGAWEYHYALVSQRLRPHATQGSSLALVMQIADAIGAKLGLRERAERAYISRSHAVIQTVMDEAKRLTAQLEGLWRQHRELWLTSRKALGLEQLDRRYGALNARLRGLRGRLGAFVRGELKRLREFDHSAGAAGPLPRSMADAVARFSAHGSNGAAGRALSAAPPGLHVLWG